MRVLAPFLAALVGPTTAVAIALAVALGTFPASAGAIIFYQTGVGYRQPEFFIYHGDDLVPKPIDVTIGGCPAPGTPNALCGRLISEAGINGGRLFLRSGARFKRTDVDPMFLESAAYADTRITITSMGGYVGSAPMAAFYFGLGRHAVQDGQQSERRHPVFRPGDASGRERGRRAVLRGDRLPPGVASL